MHADVTGVPVFFPFTPPSPPFQPPFLLPLSVLLARRASIVSMETRTESSGTSCSRTEQANRPSGRKCGKNREEEEENRREVRVRRQPRKERHAAASGTPTTSTSTTTRTGNGGETEETEEANTRAGKLCRHDVSCRRRERRATRGCRTRVCAPARDPRPNSSV